MIAREADFNNVSGDQRRWVRIINYFREGICVFQPAGIAAADFDASCVTIGVEEAGNGWVRSSPRLRQHRLEQSFHSAKSVQTPAHAAPQNRAERIQRYTDIVLSGFALMFFAPLMLIIMVGITLTSPGPVFFRHPRLGRGRAYFDCWKFRTMHHQSDSLLADLLQRDPAAQAEWLLTHKLKDDPRVSAFGAFLRRTSLDELPQLLCVMQGKMSMVGPRPIVAAEVDRYGRRIWAYDAVRPGITGLWQVTGRNQTSYRYRVACDVHYARTRSVKADLAIIAKTVPAVLFCRGAY